MEAARVVGIEAASCHDQRPCTIPYDVSLSNLSTEMVTLTIFSAVSIGLLADAIEELEDTSIIELFIFDLLVSTTPLSIIGSRIFFNLKEAADHGVSTGSNWASYANSAIRFNGPMSEEAL